MFKRENRLVPTIRFGRQNFFSAQEFILKEKKNNLFLNRFGIVVSKKIDKRSTARNKIKRIFRESLLELNKKMTVGHDILFIIKRPIDSKEKARINIVIEKSLEKVGLIR